MIVDRYDPINLFELVPKLKLEMDPELAHLDRLLDDDVLFERVKADLSRRYPNSGRLGRHSTPVEVVLRMLVVKRLYNFSYEQTERFVNDSIVLRQFTRLYLERVPDDTTLIRWANVIGSQTVASLNERTVELARSLKITRGRNRSVRRTAQRLHRIARRKGEQAKEELKDAYQKLITITQTSCAQASQV